MLILNLFKEWLKDFKPMITHVYTLNTTNQLVDINDTYTSFTTMYSVTCDNIQDEFEYALASQNMLDNNKQVYFKKAIGYIEDSITHNEGSFENWYLILRARKNTPCKVMLEITSLDVLPSSSSQPSTQVRRSPIRQEDYQDDYPQHSQPQRQPRRRLPPKRPIRQRPPPPQPDSDDDSEDETVENFTQESSTDPFNWWWYISILLIIIIIMIFLMWRFDKLHLLPFYKYFIINKTITSSSHSPLLTPPLMTQNSILLPPTPPVTPVPVDVQSVVIVEPSTPSTNVKVPNIVAPPPLSGPQLDTNFINEMRELKLNF